MSRSLSEMPTGGELALEFFFHPRIPKLFILFPSPRRGLIFPRIFKKRESFFFFYFRKRWYLERQYVSSLLENFRKLRIQVAVNQLLCSLIIIIGIMLIMPKVQLHWCTLKRNYEFFSGERVNLKCIMDRIHKIFWRTYGMYACNIIIYNYYIKIYLFVCFDELIRTLTRLKMHPL